MPFGPPVGGWLNAEGQVFDASVFDFGPRTDTAKAAADAALGAESNLQVLSIARAVDGGGGLGSKSASPTRNAHSRAWITTLRIGDSGTMLAAWQNGAAATPVGVVYSFSNDGGLTWSAPVQIDASTTRRPSLITDPNTNNVFVFLEQISPDATSIPVCRVLPYTGVPGAPAWGPATAAVNQSGPGNFGEDLAVDVTPAGIAFAFWYDSISLQGRATVWTNPWDHTVTTQSNQQSSVGGTLVWQDVHYTAHFSGTLFLVAETGGQFHLYAQQILSGSPTLVQKDSFFASNSEDGATSVLEQFSSAYNDFNDQLCLAYVNGTSITYKTYQYNGSTMVVVAGPTIITAVNTAHAPLVQAAADGSFYVVWVENSPSATQRKIRCINTANPTIIFDLWTDSGSNTIMWLDGPRSTEPNALLQFMVGETANAVNRVWLITVPIAVFKTLADSGTFVDGSPLGIEVSFGEVATAADDPQQTRVISPSTCQEGRTALDQWTFDIAAFDDPCIPNDVADQAHATEILNLSPELLETATGTEAFVVGPTFNEDVVAVDDFGIAPGTDTTPGVIGDTTAGDDQPTVDQQPAGDQNDVAAAAEGILLEVLADDQGVAVEAYTIAPDDDGAGHVTESPVAVEAYDLQTTSVGDNLPPSDVASGAEGTMDVGVQFDETGLSAEVFDVAPGGFDETGTAVEDFDIMITVAEIATAVDSDPSADAGISKDCLETATAVDVFTVTHNQGLSVRLRMVRGNAKLHLEGNQQQRLNVRN